MRAASAWQEVRHGANLHKEKVSLSEKDANAKDGIHTFCKATVAWATESNTRVRNKHVLYNVFSFVQTVTALHNDIRCYCTLGLP
jgi:hypothetical protein